MNTKDIWQALTANEVTEKYFDGVFPVNKLKNITTKPRLVICNTDPSNKPGEHWVLFFFNKDNSVDFYDSLGKSLISYNSDFLSFVNKFSSSYHESKVRTQPKNTALCGYYCLYFAYKRCKGKKMETIIEDMKSSLHVVNFVNRIFKFCKLTNNKFQTCQNL